MRIAISILILLFLYQYCAMAQINHKRENVWAFGNFAGIDFNSGTPQQIHTQSQGYNGASICDTNGQLLFYTNGWQIWNKNHHLMPVGDNLFFPLIEPWMYWPDRNYQGAIIVPMPGSDYRYYVFSMTQLGAPGPITSTSQYERPHVRRLYYSIVDMRLNGGLGDVEPGQRLILIDSLLGSNMMSVAGDRCNVWLMTTTTGTYDGFDFRAYEITEAGLNLSPIVSNIKSANFDHQLWPIRFSPDRKKIVIPGREVKLYDFDPLTGKVFYRTILNSPPYLLASTFTYSGCACFSPDNTKLYVSIARTELVSGIPFSYFIYRDSIYQYDLNQGYLRTTIGSDYDYRCLKAGPDGKLYNRTGNNSMGCINSPNKPGIACDYVQNAIVLASLSPYSNITINYGQTGEVSFVQKKHLELRDTIIACFQDSVTLQIDTANEGWDIQWDHGPTARTIKVASGIYTVSYRTPTCTYHTDTFVVHITPKPSSGSLYQCRALHNGMAFIQPGVGSTDTYTYTWSDSTGKLLQQHTTTGADTLFHMSQGSYTVRMQAESGCDTIIRIRVSPTDSNTQASFNTATTACADEPVQFNNTSTPDFISYTWYFGDNTNAYITDPSHIYQQGGAYTVTLIGATATPCYDTAVAIIQINPPVVIELGADTFLCKPTALQLQPVGDNSYSYLWKPATVVSNPVIKNPFFIGKTTQALILEATNSFGCKASDTMTIVVDTTAALKVNDTFICLGDTVQLNVKGAATYRWIAGSAYISNPTIANPLVSPKHHHPYIVIGTKVSGCIDTAIAMVKVDSASSISFVMDRADVCQGQYVNFTPVYRNGSVKQLLWNLGNVPGTVSGWQQKHRFDINGTYIITITAKYAVCPDSTYSDTIVVYPYLIVNVGPDTFICPNSAPIILTNFASSVDQNTYLWSTGETNRSVLIKQPGTYYVTVTSGKGCSTTDTIVVAKSCYIDIPNAFTPNGDGVNDYFFPRELLSHNVSRFHMQVFNRWGQTVFETNKINGNGWDGRFNDVPQPEGVYVYLIEAMVDNVTMQTYKGNVSLLR